MPATIFVALQCCQCSTMQVKQRKKSSSQWTCVVCNQKQSVLKVFAQGPMAKDLRKFVQSFNMSRKVADFDPTSEYDDNFEDDGGGDLENQRKRRSDWSEYLDPEEEEQGSDLEPEIVTELPSKEKFKRSKLMKHEIGEGGDHQLYKPVFSNRNSRKDAVLISQGGPSTLHHSYISTGSMSFPVLIADEKPTRKQQAMGDMGRNASKWSDITVGIDKESMRDCKAATVKENSKWKDYITEDGDGW